MLGVNLSGAEFGNGNKYGYDYAYPTFKDLSFYASQGIDMVRVPVKWERLQPTLGGALDATELARLKTFLDKAEQAGVQVIVDLHNFGTYDGKVIGSATTPIASFADFWSKLAGAIGDKPAVMGYDIMNEPHGMPTDMTWPEAAQAATDAIRKLGDTHSVFVEGEHWAGAANWTANNPYLDVKDALNRVVYEAHVYFDDNGSGTYKGSYDQEGAYADIGAQKLRSFIGWLNDHNAQGFIGEFSVPSDDPRWQVVLDRFLQVMEENELSGTYWGAGSMFNGYDMGLIDKKGQPTPSMATLVKHVVGSADIELGFEGPVGAVAGTALTGDAKANALKGSDGADLLDGGAGADTMTGGKGDDRYFVDHAGDAVVEHRAGGVDTVNASVSYVLGDFVENLLLTDQAANGTGNAMDNAITGNALANTLIGMAGDDWLDGGVGADRLEGGNGNDNFIVDHVGDVVVEAAKAGTDTVRASLTWTLGANLEKLVLTGAAMIDGTGNTADNALTGNEAANQLWGKDGDDVIFGGGGDDRIDGGSDDDRIDGGAGADLIFGRTGRDWLTGGVGKDVFAYFEAAESKSNAPDRIMDFTVGEDRVDLSRIDASTKRGGDQAFTLIGTDAFSNTAGELRYEARDGYTIIQGDRNGDGVADFAVRLENFTGSLHANDFLL